MFTRKLIFRYNTSMSHIHTITKKLYSVAEAAKILDLTVQAIHHAIKVGALKAEKLGFFYVIRETEIEKYKHYEKREHGKWARKI